MPSLSRFRLLLLPLVALPLLWVSLGCDYFDTSDPEAEILEAPTTTKIIDQAEDLGLKPLDLLERRRKGAIRDLRELYDDRIDEAVSERAVDRIETQHDRALVKLHKNYDLREDRVKDRLARDKKRKPTPTK